MIISVTNHGPLIAETNYWGSAIEQAGKLYVSVNAGAVRLLLPRRLLHLVGEMRSSRHVILSRGPWPAMKLPEAVELLFEDGTDSPFSLHLSPESFDVLPAAPEPGLEWVLSVWVDKAGPHKALERRCYWRRSARLPDLSLWQ